MKKEFEDTIEDIQKAIKDAAAIAIAESKALKLPITYLKDNQIIREYADGRIEVLKTINPPSNNYQKGQVLYVKED